MTQSNDFDKKRDLYSLTTKILDLLSAKEARFDTSSEGYRKANELIAEYCSTNFPELSEMLFNNSNENLVFYDETKEGYLLYYYNPDSVSEGQIVCCELDEKGAREIVANPENLMDILAGYNQYLADVDTINYFECVTDLIEYKIDGLYLGNDVSIAFKDSLAKDRKPALDNIITAADAKHNEKVNEDTKMQNPKLER